MCARRVTTSCASCGRGCRLHTVLSPPVASRSKIVSFHSPLVARIAGVNRELVATLRDVVHPMFDVSRLDELEELIEQHAGAPYLDLDLAIARRAIAIVAGDAFEAIDIATVSRPDEAPRHWLHGAGGRAMIESDLARKETGESNGGFHDRLIGVFASLTPIGEERPYFNSPVCCRVEHGKVRLIARDRFNVLGLAGSERMKFDRFRELLDAQNSGAAERLLAIKYPHTSRIIAASVAAEAAELCERGPVHVMFIDGIGGWNPTTAGLIDAELHAALPAGAVYHRVTARDAYAELPPFAGGVLPIVAALAANPPSLFENSELAAELVNSVLQSVIDRVVPATSNFHS